MEKTLNIAIAGLGTVGAGVAKILLHKEKLLANRSGRKLRLAAVSARDTKKDRGVDLSKIDWVQNSLDLVEKADIVVELIGGADGTAYELAKKTLGAGKHFVTANKALIAKHGVELAKLAEAKNAALKFEASVAGGIPVIKTIREGLAANQFTKIAGILNGTCNYILTAMDKDGVAMETALKEAQRLGYAEAEPSFDIDGTDTAHKLAILASLAFGTPVNLPAISIEGIRPIAREDILHAKALGYRIKLLGIAALSPKGLEQRVHPTLVPEHSPLASVDGVINAVEMQGDTVGALFLEGPGAGQGPTASAVVADIVDIAAGRFTYPFGVPVAALESLPAARLEDHQGAYYLRLNVTDKPGVMAHITRVFEAAKISIANLVQKAKEPGAPVDIVFTTHATSEKTLHKALTEISGLTEVLAKPVVIRIEEV